MKHFCVMPWYSREINLKIQQDSICCWLQKPVSRLRLQQDFIDDKKPESCQKCWHLENSGIESRRQMENRFLDFALDRNIESIANKIDDAEPMLYQFNLGSLCNSTCVTCGANASSAWQSLLKKQIKISSENDVIDRNFDYYQSTINWKTIKRINLLGGEPLLIEKSFDILDMLLSNNNTDCLVSFVTNGSVALTKKHIDMFANFSNISCCVSIDGTDKLFEYVRYPLSWDRTLTNIDQYRQIFREVVVSYTISNLNIHEKQNTIDWFAQQGLLYIENYVRHPDYFSSDVKPGHALWPKFVEAITTQDKIKGISIDDYIPYVANLIKG
jgi:MoaA/NifB/PqqE/SkfB family radical SAM enzyme